MGPVSRLANRDVLILLMRTWLGASLLKELLESIEMHIAQPVIQKRAVYGMAAERR